MVVFKLLVYLFDNLYASVLERLIVRLLIVMSSVEKVYFLLCGVVIFGCIAEILCAVVGSVSNISLLTKCDRD